MAALASGFLASLGMTAFPSPVSRLPSPTRLDLRTMTTGRIGDAPKLGLWSRIKRIATTDVGALMRGMNAADLEEMERVLLEADFGVKATVELTQALEDQVRRGSLKTENDLRRELTERIAGLLAGPPNPERIAVGDGAGPTVVLFIGVNGVGRRPVSPSWRVVSPRKDARCCWPRPIPTGPEQFLSSRPGAIGSRSPPFQARRVAIPPRWPSTRSMQPTSGAVTLSSSIRRDDSTPRRD